MKIQIHVKNSTSYILDQDNEIKLVLENVFKIFTLLNIFSHGMFSWVEPVLSTLMLKVSCSRTQ